MTAGSTRPSAAIAEWTDEISEALSALLREGTDAVRGRVSAPVSGLEIDADEPLQINLDGEPIADINFVPAVPSRRSRRPLPRLSSAGLTKEAA